MSLLETASLVAYAAHYGQTDNSGIPYIEHPRKVASFLSDERDKVLAMLHDVIEDTFLTEGDLRPVFGDDIVDTLLILTKGEGEDYFDYIGRITGNQSAIRVKMADIKHNSDMTRISNPTQRDFDRLAKYKKAEEILRAALES
ncbi:MAG: HD domain-containing protein [Lachnospiraceae bacterium]|nr:HD domain-containing protein [Lachnospiraceae bacterium]